MQVIRGPGILGAAGRRVVSADGAGGRFAPGSIAASDDRKPASRVRWYWIGHPADLRRNCDRILFRDLPDARAFLVRLSGDPANLSGFRSLLGGDEHVSRVHALSDGEVLDRLAWALWTGRLRVGVEYVPVRGGPSSPPMPELPLSGPPRRAAEPAPRPRREPPPPEVDPLVETMDVLDQAEGLRDAARDGIPFCEECAKARLRHEHSHG